MKFYFLDSAVTCTSKAHDAWLVQDWQTPHSLVYKKISNQLSDHVDFSHMPKDVIM